MKIQPLLVALTIANAAMLAYQFARPNVAEAQGSASILRGKGLEIVDDKGKVRASITLFPADPKVKMPDGTTGYPETVLLRLINSKGRPTVKVSATEDGSGLSLGGDTDPTYATIIARGATTSMKLTNHDGKEHVVKP